MNYFEKLNLQQQTHQDFNTLFKETKLVIFLVTSIYINVQFREKIENYAQSAKELIAGSFSRKIPRAPNNEDFSKFSWIFLN